MLKNFCSRVTPPRPFYKKYLEITPGKSLETCPSHLKSVALMVLELLAFTA